MGVDTRPPHSMKSTWQQGDRSEWTIYHWFIEIFHLHQIDASKPPPVFKKTDPVPYIPRWYTHFWVITHALWPMALHQGLAMYFGRNLPVLAVFGIYTLAYNINAGHEIRMMRRIGEKYGYLDGDRYERDQIPDSSVPKITTSLVATTTLRPMMTLMAAYRSDQLPTSISPWVVIETGLYAIVLDFFFYWYHRVMHDTDGLWQFHRTHHLTKHPNPLLSLFADAEQEFFDIIGIPLMTFFTLRMLGFPMTFYDWWICHEYVVYTELWGHSGLRVMTTGENAFTPLLEMVGMEINTEDHDLHHRKGWRSSHNYGKQTRVWDRLFGTCHERIELRAENVDKDNIVHLEWF